jgi:hypothetical protein
VAEILDDLPPSVRDNMAEARLNGYGWDEINGHIEDSTDTALASGYTQPEIDAHLGYQPLPYIPELHEEVGKWAETEPHTKDDPEPISPPIAQAYANAMRDGAAKDPTDFASNFTDDPALQDALAAQLPHPEETIDHAIAVAHAFGAEDMPTAAQTANGNLLDLWAQTGVTPQEALASRDPVLQDALVTPPLPNQPTLADLEAKGRDAITTPYGPWGGPMQDDPTGLGGAIDMVKALAALPFTDGKWREDMLAAVQAGDTAKLAELKQHPPALETLTPLFLAFLGGRALGEAGKGAAAAAEKVAPTFREMLADETGSLKGTGKDAEGTRAPEQLDESGFPLRVAADAQASVDRLGRSRDIERPAEMPLPPELGEEPHFFGIHPIEDELFRLRGNATADRIEAMKFVEGLPQEWAERASSVSRENEKRLIDPSYKLPDDVQEVMTGLKPWTDEQTSLATKIKARLNGIEIPEVEGIRSAEEGYVRRVVKDAPQGQSQFDPELSKDAITGANLQFRGPRTNPTSLQPRDFYVMEKDGQRVFGDKPLSQAGLKMGEERDGWTVKPATMDEIEAGTSGWEKPVKYDDHFIGNTVDNVLKLRRIDKLLDVLGKQKADAIEAGKFEPITKANQYAPSNDALSVRVQVPQFDGWAAPEVGHPVNDLFNAHKMGDLERALTATSRGLLSSLFISPIAHIANVGAHWLPGRGLDWLNPAGYGRLLTTTIPAMREVLTMGPKYQALLREGMGGLYGDTRMANFTQMMQRKLFHDQVADEGGLWSGVAKTALHSAATAVDLVKAEYAWSRRTLWAANDMFLMQRVLELEKKGLSTREAIYQAEVDIPNYRVPSMVAGSHAVSQAIQNPLVGNFGRYHYGLVRALAANLQVISPSATMGERAEAVGKIAALTGLAYAWTQLNSAFQDATGNKNAEVRPPGPLSPIFAAKGLLGGNADWLKLSGTMYGLSPVVSLAGMLSTNRDVFGRKIVDGNSTPLGQIVQALEASANLAYPLQLLHGVLKHGPEELLKLININMHSSAPSDADAAKYAKRDQSMATARERKDPIESWLRDNLGLGPVPGASREKGLARSETRGFDSGSTHFSRNFQFGDGAGLAGQGGGSSYTSPFGGASPAVLRGGGRNSFYTSPFGGGDSGGGGGTLARGGGRGSSGQLRQGRTVTRRSGRRRR